MDGELPLETGEIAIDRMYADNNSLKIGDTLDDGTKSWTVSYTHLLDIFAGRATTSEGKIQVELAQLRYRAARLVGLRESLSRLGGGIGTRGPGEMCIRDRDSRKQLRLVDVSISSTRNTA